MYIQSFKLSTADLGKLSCSVRTWMKTVQVRGKYAYVCADTWPGILMKASAHALAIHLGRTHDTQSSCATRVR